METKAAKKRALYLDLAIELNRETGRRKIAAMFNICCFCKHVEFEDNGDGGNYISCWHPAENIHDKVCDIADCMDLCDCWAFRPAKPLEKAREDAMHWIGQEQDRLASE